MLTLPIGFYAISSFINAVLSLTVGFFVFFKNRKNQKNIGFFSFSMFVGWWTFFYYIWQTTQDYSTDYWPLFWSRVLIGFCIFIPAGYLHFVYALVGMYEKRKKFLFFTYGLFFIFFLTDFTPLFVSHVEQVMNFRYWPIAGPAFTAYMVTFLIYVTYTCILLVRKYRALSGIARLQIKYFTIGAIISFAGGSVNFLPWYRIPVPPVTHILVCVHVIMTAYSITRYRMMDIGVIVRKVVFYFGLSFFAYLAFYAIAGMYTLFFGSIFSPQAYLMGLLVAPIFAIFLYNGSRFFSDFANKYVFSSLYNYQETINEVSQQLSHYTDLEKIMNVIIGIAQKTLQLDGVAILLAESGRDRKMFFRNAKSIGFKDGPEVSKALDFGRLQKYFAKTNEALIREELDQLIYESKNPDEKLNLYQLKVQMSEVKASLCLPLIIENRFFGTIVVGSKSDSGPFTNVDLDLLEALSYQAGIALDNAMLYEKIAEKNKNLQELLNVKNDFIRITNHQLNTPLSIMRNAYYMVKDGSLPLKDGLVYWGNGVERMSQVVQDFWEVFQFENENIPIRPEKVNISSIVRKLVDAKKKANISTGEKKVKVLIEKPDFKIPFAWCEPKKITHALSNLLDNALLYTPKGNVKISYELEGSDFLKVSIKDTGIGIKESDKGNIAQKFYRSRQAVGLHPDGSGLGVYISKKIVEENGGKLDFYSAGENKGATFSITIPVFKNSI